MVLCNHLADPATLPNLSDPKRARQHEHTVPIPPGARPTHLHVRLPPDLLPRDARRQPPVPQDQAFTHDTDLGQDRAEQGSAE